MGRVEEEGTDHGRASDPGQGQPPSPHLLRLASGTIPLTAASAVALTRAYPAELGLRLMHNCYYCFDAAARAIACQNRTKCCQFRPWGVFRRSIRGLSAASPSCSGIDWMGEDGRVVAGEDHIGHEARALQ